MNPSDRREREKAATRQKILDGARDLVVEEGIDALTMRRLAERIAYSPTAVYVHFADKEALLTELSVCDFKRFTDQFGLVPRGVPPLVRLQALGKAYVAFAQAYPATYRHLFMTVRTLSEEARKQKPEEDAYDILMATVNDAIASGEFHPGWADKPHHVAQVLWTSLHGIVSLDLAMPKNTDVPTLPVSELADAAMAVCLAGLRAPPPPVA